MLRAIIVDDEEIVRRGLRYHYHWDKYDIQIVKDFPEGESAYAYISEHQIDIIITDVVMPRMNGLELAKKAREINPDIKIIFISGYADVQYLSDALRMNAVDYIFKSIDFEALDAAIERTINIVQQRNSELERQKWLENQLQLNLDVLRQQRLVSLISYTEESEDSISGSCAALSLPLNSKSNYAVMVVRVTNSWNLLERKNSERYEIILDLDLQKSLQECLIRRGNEILFKKRSYEYISIINTDIEDYEELLLTLSTEIQIQVKHKFKAEIAIGISECFRGLRNVRNAYKNACESIYNRYLIDKSLPDITFNKYPQSVKQYSLRESIRAEVNDSILDGNTEQIQKAVIQSIASAKALESVDEQQNLLLYLLMLPQDLLRGLPPQERGCYTSCRKLLEEFLLLHDLHEQEEFIIRSFVEASELINKNNSQQNNYIIKRVISYIEEHYMDAISIDVLAEAVYLTPTYLCVLFKKYTGKTINNYLTEVRLEKAKDFLRQSNHQLQDICYKVGYLSPSYFSRLFRKYYGQTPGEYRESFSNG